MTRTPFLFVALVLFVASCATPPKSDQKTTLTLESGLIGHWKGTAPDHSTVEYTFRADGTVLWDIPGHPSIRARYETRPNGDFIAVDIFGFETPQFEGVRFLGIAKINDQQMMFFGIPSKDGRTEDGSTAIRPASFGADSITFFRVE